MSGSPEGSVREEGLREAILEAAYRVFGARGFSGTTVKEIAAEAGVAPGSIYTYFRDKEDLFCFTVRRGWNQFLAEIRRIVASEGLPRLRLAGILDYSFEVLRDALPLLRGMLFEAHQRDLLQENLEELCRILEGVLGSGRGAIRATAGRAADAPAGADGWPMVRITVFGILLTVALTRDERLDGEIERIKRGLQALVEERLQRGGRGDGRPVVGEP
jgi:AcrR family transcriptional regulator